MSQHDDQDESINRRSTTHMPAMVLPRGLIFLSFLWLVISWGMVIGFDPPMQPSPASYEPGVRLMLVNVMIGLMIGWPLWRLSIQRVGWPIRQTLLDVIVMLSMAQVVVWPLRLVTTWTRGRTALMDVLIILWTLTAAAFVATAMGSSRRVARTMAMLGCVLLVFLGPAVTVGFNWLGVEFDLVMQASPLVALYEAASAHGSQVSMREWGYVVTSGLAASVSWLGVVVLSFVGRSSGKGTMANVS